MNYPRQEPLNETLRHPLLIVFIASFCLMVIEIIAGRIMAPYLGVSLYTWTSIIGVVLAGISIGNYAGGKISDRYPRKQVVGFIFLISSAASYMIIIFSYIAGRVLVSKELSLPVSTFLYSLIVFFLPSITLSMVTPMVIKLCLKNLNEAGITVGKIYAYSTVGSIVGTLITGYFLIAWLGTKFIVVAVSTILCATGFVLSFDVVKKLRNKFLILGVVLALNSAFIPNTCYTESQYYCIQLLSLYEGDRLKGTILRLDYLNHGFVARDTPKELGYRYEKSMALVTQYMSKKKIDFKSLFLGGGGYVLPRFMETAYPESQIEVVEIDPRVTEINFSKLWLDPNTNIGSHNQDARMFVQRLEEGARYDVIVGDVFNDISVPYHLTTKEFNDLIVEHLEEDGMYAVNIIDDIWKGRFLVSYIYTIQKSFQYVYLVPQFKRWRDLGGRSTYIVLASQKPVHEALWEEANRELIQAGLYTAKEGDDIQYMVDTRTLRIEEHKSKIFLTDEYAPVDNLLAPVFKYKYQREDA